MKDFYPYLKSTLSTFLTLFLTIIALSSSAQICEDLTATFTSYESRCAATGSIKIVASGGSGSYKYKVTGPVNTNFTSTDSITGLQTGTYTVEVKDLTNNCSFVKTGIKVLGNYEDIRFSPIGTDISCEGAQNGSIALGHMENGRAPFTWTVMAPSPMAVGTSNNTGAFSNLMPGDYRIRMTDSCGGIQTRIVTVYDYTWTIESYSFTKSSCNAANGFIKVTDSRNNISTVGGIPGFMYGVVRSAGDTVWSASATFTVNIPGITSIGIVVKDGCGKVKKGATDVSFLPSVGASVNITNKACGTFSASLTAITNYFTPTYTLVDNNNAVIATNSTGSFNNIPYGSYCINALDGCTNTTISRCFSVGAPPLSVGNLVAISNKNCTTFTATITSKVGLTNPTFELYNSSSVKISSNNTGVFTNIPYGSYSISTKDGCRDTTIQRFFTENKWRPKMDPSVTPAYMTCSTFGINVGGDSLTAPLYCLYDDLGTQIACNNTGKFDSLLVGSYTLQMHDGCVDTTIIRNFTVASLTVSNDISISTVRTGCNQYKATVNSANLKGATYTLYTNANVIYTTNNTGIFTDLPAGSYYVMSRNACPDTTFKNSFTLTNPVPSVNGTVTTNTFTCSTFTASVTGQQNLTTPQYALYDNSNQLLSTNTSGVFSAISYGSYTIKITNSCYDTVITRNFTVNNPKLTMSLTTTKSCVYGNSDFKLILSNGNAPYNVKAYNMSGNLLYDNGSYYTTTIKISNIPGIVTGQTYKFVVTDNCGKKDSANVVPTNSTLVYSSSVTSVCPGDIWPNGSGTIAANVITNMGSVTIKIIKKDGLTLSPAMTPTTVTGAVYSFNNLGPATYILSYQVNDACSRIFYDTLAVAPYTFPSLQKSTAYQCDANGFTVGAAATNGVAPFTYEIIGSFPASPSIQSGEQANPLFNIDNGQDYSLVRLRALDACGNGTLGDVSILPLASNKIVFDNNCFLGKTTLTVDPLYNSEYKWYYKTNREKTDSVLVSEGAGMMVIPALLPADTGVYICKISVAGGCIIRTYNTRLDGSCYMVLSASSLKFSGKYENEMSKLNWTIKEQNNIASYTIERKNNSDVFVEIGKVDAEGKPGYSFTDMKPGGGTNFYRLKTNFNDQTFSYSNIIALGNDKAIGTINVFPNPVTDFFTVEFNSISNHKYNITLMNVNSQVISQQTFNSGVSKKLVIQRGNLSNGLYLVKIVDNDTRQEYIHKIIFK